MADFHAIRAVSETVLRMLRANYREEDFDQELRFAVYTSVDFNHPMDHGVSLFLYRIYHNGSHRIPAGRVGPDGRADTRLPLDLHYLLTAWAEDAALQHTIAGWMMRALEDHPTLTAAQLNEVVSGSFYPEETVDLVLTELTTEDLLRAWETMTERRFQLSVPYMARIVHIDSSRRRPAAPAVREREIDIVDPVPIEEGFA